MSEMKNQPLEDLLEEFSIEELDDRLEFTAWCDGNCSCKPKEIGPGPILV